MQRRVEFAPDEYYHIYNRGVEKREIFMCPADYVRFMKLLYIANSEKEIDFRALPDSSAFEQDRGDTLVDIGAYVLMKNHFHLLVYEKKEHGISRFMKKVLTSHSMFFNKKYKRTGVLFQNVFQSSHAESDEYLQYLFAYIHLNPIKYLEPDWKEEGIQDFELAKKFLEDYRFSSFIDYAMPEVNRIESKILRKESFPDYFVTAKDFKDFIEYWLDYKDQFTPVGEKVISMFIPNEGESLVVDNTKDSPS